MTVLTVHFHPDAVLRQIAKPIDVVTPDILKLLDDMVDTMAAEEGIGLAAPQVGVALRAIIVDPNPRDDKALPPLKMLNPEIIATSETKSMLDEGCLSLPEMRVDVTRPDVVTVRYMDIDGKIQEIAATGILAKCLQHEIDHLNGVLIFDYLSSLKRDMTLRRYNKYMRGRGA